MSRACSTAHGSCGPHHSPRSGLAGYYTPFREPCVCSTASTVGRYCSPTHLLHRGPRASVDAPAPSGLRGFHRAPSSGPYEHHPPHATSFAPALNGPLTPAPADDRILYDDSSSLTSNSLNSFGLRADFVASLQAAHRTLVCAAFHELNPSNPPPPQIELLQPNC